MSETTPECAPNNAQKSSSHNILAQFTYLQSADSLEALQDRFSIKITPSRYLWRFELFIFFGFLFCYTLALLPFFLTAFYWPCLWLLGVFVVVHLMYCARRNLSERPVNLIYRQDSWCLLTAQAEIRLAPVNAIVLWSWIIIMPFEEVSTNKKYLMTVLSDSVGPDEWRRLKVWLRLRGRIN